MFAALGLLLSVPWEAEAVGVAVVAGWRTKRSSAQCAQWSCKVMLPAWHPQPLLQPRMACRLKPPPAHFRKLQGSHQLLGWKPEAQPCMRVRQALARVRAARACDSRFTLIYATSKPCRVFLLAWRRRVALMTAPLTS